MKVTGDENAESENEQQQRSQGYDKVIQENRTEEKYYFNPDLKWFSSSIRFNFNLNEIHF